MTHRASRSRSPFAFLIPALLLIAGCAPGKVGSIYRDPSLTGPLNFKKIIVLCVHPDRITRKTVEDEMVKQIGPERTTAGYTVISDEERKQVDVVKSKIQEKGFDGAVVLKLAGSRTDTGGGSSNTRTFYQDYDRNVAAMDDSGGVSARVIVSVQTNIYSVSDAKLLWSGTTDLYDPTHAPQMVDDIVKLVGDTLRKEKLMK